MSVHRAALVVASIALAAGCGSGDDEPTPDPRLLQREDVGEVAEVDVDAGRSITRTDCADLWVEASNARTEADSPVVRYELESGDTVISTVQGPRTGQVAIDRTFAEVDAAIDACTGQDLRTTVLERLADLPAGAIGFREHQDDSGGVQLTERAYARLDDRSAVVVTVVHRGGGAPAVTVAELLRSALERAESA